MIPAAAILAGARSVGVSVTLANGLALEVDGPEEVLDEAFLSRLAEHKPAILCLLRTEREAEVARLISATCDRLSSSGSWTSADVDQGRKLGIAADSTCRDYFDGAVDLPAVELAVRRWETALSVGRAQALERPPPRQPGRGS
jgi:hypothetical protein